MMLLYQIWFPWCMNVQFANNQVTFPVGCVIRQELDLPSNVVGYEERDNFKQNKVLSKEYQKEASFLSLDASDFQNPNYIL